MNLLKILLILRQLKVSDFLNVFIEKQKKQIWSLWRFSLKAASQQLAIYVTSPKYNHSKMNSDIIVIFKIKKSTVVCIFITCFGCCTTHYFHKELHFLKQVRKSILRNFFFFKSNSISATSVMKTSN